MMIAALVAALGAFACFVLGVATGTGQWYIGTIVCAGIGLVVWLWDWWRKHRNSK
ncbi:hypothetical protein CEPID_08305 [Corynebacterium epidermidicanis]|uniref:DUF2530 family protein n=1 Tax=Corynebacterium epidermidicanis TaxID=1050174 RepID=A0A0G3GQN7_9CORY|nr:hypothetical protein CEPID_08305 [Corynebacterium epidermidicanis]